jgi:hypothetical protein
VWIGLALLVALAYLFGRYAFRATATNWSMPTSRA